MFSKYVRSTCYFFLPPLQFSAKMGGGKQKSIVLLHFYVPPPNQVTNGEVIIIEINRTKMTITSLVFLFAQSVKKSLQCPNGPAKSQETTTTKAWQLDTASASEVATTRPDGNFRDSTRWGPQRRWFFSRVMS